ncbi:MAG: hypothetical protein IPK14_00670 [Blastocatellia bacterium]|nr:hypothetical protein [Blastocatellia bacterium]MBL8195083.1 hypothetical protein [Blastocatellia bacterium]MBN8721427.1 hypothetical protein [Acidobacteriota bacterium]
MLKKLFLFTLILFCFSLTTQAQTVDEIISKNIQARGGSEKLKAVKTIKQTGILVQQGQELPVVIQVKRPNNARFEISIQSQQIILAYDGQTAWGISPFLGTKDAQKLPEEQAKDVVDLADVDGLLVDYKEKGHKIEFVGKEDLEGSPAYKLKITKKNGDVVYSYIDVANSLEIKTAAKQTTPQGELEVETYQSDYKSVEGVLFSHSVESKTQGQTILQVKINKTEVNLDIDDNLFKIPTKSAEK